MAGRISTAASRRDTRARAQAGHRRSLAIELEGPFFKADIAKTLGQNAHDFVALLASDGERIAQARTFAAVRKSAGPSSSARAIRGRVEALTGRPWSVTAVVSAVTDGMTAEEAVRTQAVLAGRHNPIASGTDEFGAYTANIGTTPGHEGTDRVFARTAADLRRYVRKLDLTKGLGG